jgi:16S rRNA processing protein RimM
MNRATTPDPRDAREGNATWLIVAELGPPHGIRGEITGRLCGVTADELRGLAGLVLRDPRGDERPIEIAGIRRKKSGWILALEGIGDRDAAEACRGSVLRARRECLPAPREDEWYVADLVGLRVETVEGEFLGTVEEVLRLPANDVLAVRGERGEILLPMTEEVLRSVRPDEGRAIVHLLPGLVEATGGESGAGSAG